MAEQYITHDQLLKLAQDKIDPKRLTFIEEKYFEIDKILKEAEKALDKIREVPELLLAIAEQDHKLRYPTLHGNTHVLDLWGRQRMSAQYVEDVLKGGVFSDSIFVKMEKLRKAVKYSEDNSPHLRVDSGKEDML